jgi:hypothetical protein
VLKGLIRVKDNQNKSSGISKSGQFGDPIGQLIIALKKSFRRSSSLPLSSGTLPKKPVSGGIASSGWESSMNLNKVVPDRGEPTIIGIGSSLEGDEFLVWYEPLVLRKKDRMALVIDLVMIATPVAGVSLLVRVSIAS